MKQVIYRKIKYEKRHLKTMFKTQQKDQKQHNSKITTNNFLIDTNNMKTTFFLQLIAMWMTVHAQR